jgi:hypothetical protein
MEPAEFVLHVINFAEHQPIAISNHPLDMHAFEAAIALNNALTLFPGGDSIKVFGTTGDTIIIVRVSAIPEYRESIEFGCDRRHIEEINEICERLNNAATD